MTCEGIELVYSLGFVQGDHFAFTGDITRKGERYRAKHHHNYGRQIDGINDDAPEDVDDEAFIAEYDALCRLMLRFGHDWIMDEHSDENVAEHIRANEYTFTAEGKRFG